LVSFFGKFFVGNLELVV